MNPYRILVTGSRDWDNAQAIWAALAEAVRAIPHDRNITVVHGGCPRGADAIADDWARKYGTTIERHPANWSAHGRGAGPRRNAHMVGLGADVCLAFIKNGSRGTTGCADLAEAAGIPTTRWSA
ncbi:DUF2493 domain-containing protein [Streptomyces rubiginosohelvolus]|uniref:DUF2493 domain-containing protein n=1 Tax=Streptomyces rubiginosohelvolus TaxID=67362 RepID=UPI00379D9F23